MMDRQSLGVKGPFVQKEKPSCQNGTEARKSGGVERCESKRRPPSSVKLKVEQREMWRLQDIKVANSKPLAVNLKVVKSYFI